MNVAAVEYLDCDFHWARLRMPSFFRDHWPHMTDVQRERYRVLVARADELRQEVSRRLAERDDISIVEPVLAPPRSCLDPRLVHANG